MSETPFNLLTQKLNAFIKKYYINQLIKGSIYSAGLLVLAFLVAIFSEYFFYLQNPYKSGLFFGFLAVVAGIFVQYILIPLLKIFRITSTINYYEAAKIIGKHFPQINDKITNTLQLKEVVESKSGDFSLVLAGIDQKINELKPIPFQLAIDFKKNKKYVKFAAIPLFVLLIVSFTSPSFIKEGTTRFVNYNVDYDKPLPFYFELDSDNLEATKNEDFELVVTTNGELTPEKVFVAIDGNQFKMKTIAPGKFSYMLKNVQKPIRFNFIAEPVESKDFELKLMPKPIIKGLNIQLNYPAYTQKQPEEVDNSGNLNIPEGTKVSWKFNVVDADTVKIFTDTLRFAKQVTPNEFVANQEVLQSTDYWVAANNRINSKFEKVSYTIHVIKDQYPTIDVVEIKDTLSMKQLYFNGAIADDYGLSKLIFNIKLPDSTIQQKVTMNNNALNQNFYFAYNTSNLALNPGDEVTYYFEVFDNDGVNGSKSTKSQIKTLKVPSKDQINKAAAAQGDNIKKELESAITEAKDMKAQIDDLTKKLLEKKQPGWQEKQQLEQLMEQRKNLKQKVEELTKANEQKNKMQNEFVTPNEELLEKQKQLQELFENIMDEEMKKLFEEMEKLMENMDKNQFQQSLEQMKLSNEDVEKELDRTLELFKQFEFEQGLKQAIEKLDELQQKQKNLEEETNQKKSDSDELQKKQEELNEEAKSLEEQLEELKNKNEELEEKHPFPDQKDEMQEMLNEMQKASEELEKNNKKNASENQQNAQEQMQKMKEKMEGLMGSMQMEQQTENMEDLRALLENLIELSFEQEALMQKVKTFNRNDPAFVEANQNQKKLKDNAKIIEDSLFALSKRVVQLEATVNKEINLINNNMGKAIEQLADRNPQKAATSQQFVMTSANNLALLLDEALQQMQQSMQSMMQGKNQCQKPGSGKPSASELKQRQQSLNQQMKKMLEQMKSGQNPNGQTPGSMPGMSKEIAKMAAEQAAIRRALQEMQNQMNGENGKDGKNGSELKKLQDLMEQTEEDLVNFNLRQQTLQRQEDILTRLLESEKAERERELDNKRESKEGEEISRNLEKIFEEYNKQKEKETELLRTVPPNLNLYYKNKVSEYFNNL